MTEWKPLRAVPGEALVDARLQLHHAVQIIVSAPISYLAARPDDSHTNLEWLPGPGVLATQPLPSSSRLRFALDPADLALLAIADDAERARLSLRGRAVAEGVAWMASELRRAGFDTDRLTTKKHYEIPTHAVADSAAFDASPVGLSTMAAAYHDAWLLTSDVAAREPGASPPRCWPHHFDLATLITLITLITLPALRDAVTRTIGVGVSPGDALYPEPYVYVGPYPKPDVASLPRLARGHWHTDGWVGAVLTMPDLIVFSDGAAQAETARHFATAAIAACRDLLEVR